MMVATFVKVYALFSPQERRQIFLLALLIPIGAALEVFGVGTVFPVVAMLADPAKMTTAPVVGDLYRWCGEPTPARFISLVLCGLVLIYLVKNLFLAFFAYCQGRFAYSKQASLSERLFNRYLEQPYTFHLERNSAELTRNLTVQVDSLIGAVILPAFMLLSEVLTGAALVILLLVNNPLAGAVVMGAFCTASIIFYRMIQSRLANWGAQLQYHHGQALQHLQQGLGGVKDMILMGCQPFFRQRYAEHMHSRSIFFRRQFFVGVLPLLWLEALAVAALLGLVGTLLLQGNSFEVLLPTLGMFTAAAIRLMPSVNRILVSLQNLKFCTPVVDSLYREFGLEKGRSLTNSVQSETPAQIRPLPFVRRIELLDVSFSYPRATTLALQQVSLSIGKGECIGIVGPSGSGKSTLVDIILGLLIPQQGELRVDGKNVGEELASWRCHIGYVPQTIYLTDDSLRNNVAFGVPIHAIDDARVWHALETAQLGDYVRGLSGGLDSLVGERGVRLSGGQRQRIGIARALYREPDVLVFDEATSALDNDTEAAVVAAIDSLRGRKTMLVIAHRLTTVRNCDRIIRLEAGRVVGTEG